ncbi:hypothetical protein ACQ4PT_017474 [Festuca glaucescens]
MEVDVEEGLCCCGAVSLPSMAVPSVKIANFAVWRREEEADSRSDPAPGPADQLLHRPGRCHTRPDRATDRPARPKPVPTPVPTGALVRKSLREPGSHPAPGPAETGQTGPTVGSTRPQTGQSGAQAGQTGPLTGPAAVLTPAVLSAVAVADMDSFPGDVFGIRCSRGKKSSYVFNDYLDIRLGIQRHASKLHWYLHHLATVEEYEDWEKNMELGFNRCHIYKGKFSGYDAYVLAHRRVDEELDDYWCDAVERGEFACTWEDFKTFLRDGFVLPYMEASEQPFGVVHAIEEVGKCVVPIQEVGLLQTVTKGEVISSEEKEPGSDTMGNTVTMEEDVPLSGLNMQLKRVHGDACKTVDKVQRWSLFQTQCIIKGKACKLMIDGGSCTNGISKAMVAALGLSTWRLPEPKRLEWLNSCGMLKITHKVRVPFTVDDYVDEIECDVLPLEVCGLLLGRPWQYDHNVTHARRANTYSFMHGGKQRTLKPMGDDHIKSDVELVVRKEKLHKPKVQHEVHDVPSIDVGDVSTMPVDDKPVLVGDKPDEATLVVDVDVTACATVPVCVDASIQTDDVCADVVSVHMAQMRVGGVGGSCSAIQGSIKTSQEEGIGAEVQAHVEKKGGAKCCIKSSRPRGRMWCGRQARLEDGADV